MHWARLATQGANNIQLTYSYLGPIVSDFDEIKGIFGLVFGVFFSFLSLKRQLSALKTVRSKSGAKTK